MEYPPRQTNGQSDNEAEPECCFYALLEHGPVRVCAGNVPTVQLWLREKGGWMPENGERLETDIKRVMTRCYKALYGKGPEETVVHVLDDLVIVRCDGVLTPIEESLCTTEEGKSLVKQIRDEMVHRNREDYVLPLERHLGRQIEGVEYHFNDCRNLMYLFIILAAKEP